MVQTTLSATVCVQPDCSPPRRARVCEGPFNTVCSFNRWYFYIFVFIPCQQHLHLFSCTDMFVSCVVHSQSRNSVSSSSWCTQRFLLCLLIFLPFYCHTPSFCFSFHWDVLAVTLKRIKLLTRVDYVERKLKWNGMDSNLEVRDGNKERKRNEERKQWEREQ